MSISTIEINGKEAKDVSFNELVDVLAGEALQKLIRGENWRTIIFSVCNYAAAWSSDRK